MATRAIFPIEILNLCHSCATCNYCLTMDHFLKRLHDTMPHFDTTNFVKPYERSVPSNQSHIISLKRILPTLFNTMAERFHEKHITAYISFFYLIVNNEAFIALQWCHMSVKASQINSNWTVCSTVFPGWQQRKHQGSALLALCEGNPLWPVDPLYNSLFISYCTLVLSHWYDMNLQGWF